MFCINCWTRACGWRSKHERDRTGECNCERSAAFRARFDTDDAAGSARQGGGAVAALLMVAALTAPWLTPQNPYDLMQLDVLDARLPPGSANGLGTYRYWL